MVSQEDNQKLLFMSKDILISPIKEMEIRSAKVADVISLAQGVPSFDTPLCIKRKVIEALEEGKVAKYSLAPGMFELREAIEYDLAKQNIFYDFEKEIIVTAGSIEAITASFLALLNPGDEVLIPDPTYTSYQSAILTARAVPVFVPLKEEGGWVFNINEFKKRITTKTKAILFCNPNNPTGTIYTREQLLQLAELAELHDLYILSDEVYRDFIYTNEEFYSLAQFPDFRKRVIYIYSFSKSYGMTGWRIAYLAADAELTQRIIGVHDALVTCAPVISQWGALAALEMAGNDLQQFKANFAHRRDIICQELERLNQWIDFIPPNAAYYVFPRMRQKLIDRLKQKFINQISLEKYYEIKDYQQDSISWRFALELLYKAKVAVVPGVAFGPSGKEHIRLCFGRSEQDIRTAIKRIEQYLNDLNIEG